MELLIVSGLSGAGKSVAMNALEDIGYFCIDNVPAGLLPNITAFSKAGGNQLERVALSMDVRGCRSREQIETALQQLDDQKTPYKILFLDAPDDVLTLCEEVRAIVKEKTGYDLEKEIRVVR